MSDRMKKTFLSTCALACGLVLAAPAFAAEGPAKGDTSKMKIAFSNSYAGNSFRQILVKNFESVGAQAVKDGVIAGYTVVNSNNSVTEQASQIQNLILQKYNAIVVLAGSDTALNGAIKDACAAGITVVVFNSGVTEKCAYGVDYELDTYAKIELDFLAQELGDRPANIFEIRGMAGDGFDKRLHAGVEKMMKQHPKYKPVGEVYGQWTATVAQKEVAGVLPSLPQIDGILTQGGDGYGAAQAFKAAGRKLPIILMGNREDELRLWKEERDANGYKTLSLAATPSSSQAAFWVAQQILAGKQVPKFVEIPLLTITQDTLDAWLTTVPKGGVANVDFTKDIVVKTIDANIAKTPLPGFPAPK
jgi:ribose transport system substrate-binding protein